MKLALNLIAFPMAVCGALMLLVGVAVYMAAVEIGGWE